MNNDLQIETRDGHSFSAYVALPKSLPAPAVLVLQEIFGVNAFIRGIADQFAAEGYIAVAPRLYWRQGGDIELDSDNPTDMEKALGHLGRLREEEAIEDCLAAMAAVRSLPQCTGKLGAMGYCLGGKLAYLLAILSDIDAAVAYYGTGIHLALDQASNLRAPLLLHIAGDDFLCLPEAQQQIESRISGLRGSLASEAQVHVYKGAGHGFTRKGKASYHEEATRLADQRTIDFFATLLRASGSAIPSISKRIVVEASRSAAFDIFTAGIDAWWPKFASLGETPIRASHFEPRLGGRWYTSHEDGSESVRGHVRLWDPPAEFALSWEIDALFRPDSTAGEEGSSRLEVRFVADGADRTIVELEQRHFEKMGDEAGRSMRDRCDTGWDKMLGFYKAAVEASAASPIKNQQAG